jgi:hypothetical protein
LDGVYPECLREFKFFFVSFIHVTAVTSSFQNSQFSDTSKGDRQMRGIVFISGMAPECR